MPQEAVPRIRLAPIPDDRLIVVRGTSLTDRSDAIRFRRRFHDWARYGVSGFLASDRDEVEVLLATRLERFAVADIYRRLDIIEVGLDVVPTFRRPHVTIAHADLAALVSGVRSCEHETVPNEYHRGGVADD